MHKRTEKILILLIVTMILVLGGVFWTWKNNYYLSGQLWKYAPSGTDFFVQFNLSDKEWVGFLQDNPRAKKNLENYFSDNGLPIGLWRSEKEIVEVARFGLEDKETGRQDGWIISAAGGAEELAPYLKDYYYLAVKKNVAVISKSKEIIRTIEQKRFFSSFDITQDELVRQATIAGFVRWSLIDKGINIDWPLAKMVEENFKTKDGQFVYWQLRPQAESLSLRVKLPVEVERNKIGGEDKKEESNFYVQGAAVFQIGRLENIWPMIEGASWEQNLEQKSLEEYWNKKYKTKLDKLYTIFEQPFIFVVQPGQDGQNFYKNFQGEKNYYVVVSDRGTGQEQNELARELEALIKNYLAYKFPERRLKVLPDRTSGYEVVANPDKFLLTSEKFESGELRYTRVQDFELGYFLDDQRLRFFNSVDLAKRVLWAEKNDFEQKKIAKRDLLVDPKILGEQYLDFIKVVGLDFGWYGGEMLIEGDIYVD